MTLFTFAMAAETTHSNIVVRSGSSTISRIANACQRGLHLLLESERSDFFDQTGAREQARLFSGLRVALPDTCPSARSARISGLIVGRYLFEGCAEQANGWKIRTVRLVERHGGYMPEDAEIESACPLSPDAINYPSAYLRLRDLIAAARDEDCSTYLQNAFGVGDAEARGICAQMRGARANPAPQ